MHFFLMTVLCLMSLLYTRHLLHTYRLRSAPPSATVRMRRPPPTLPWLLSLVAVLSPLRLSLLAPLVLLRLLLCRTLLPTLRSPFLLLFPTFLLFLLFLSFFRRVMPRCSPRVVC